jgi:hypothetical protein
MHRDIWQDKNSPQHGRILNRHLRGRPKNSFFKRFKNNARRRLVPPLVILAFAVAGFYILKFMELL